MVAAHQWRLVGPWYRWDTQPEDPGRMRSSRPVIQKYADSDHVEAFLSNPQKSLHFLSEDTSTSGKRKIFLDTHERFYLVACELHCDVPGFPKVDRSKVCEAGFVIRKRKTNVPAGIRTEVENLLQEMAHERSRLQNIESRRQNPGAKKSLFGAARSMRKAVDATRSLTRNKHQIRLGERQRKLQSLVEKHSISHQVLGWRSTGSGYGSWVEQTDELPQQIDEQIFPLYPLIPDQNDEAHASGHKTIWYGLLPVGSSDRDIFGNPQFDDKAFYEIRTFVRRHKDPCKKTSQRADCQGELVWSRPTETYQLASHFDLLGTSNRISMIQAPNLAELAEQTNSPEFKIGQGLGLAVVTPADSSMPIVVDENGDPQEAQVGGLPSICFFSIPLITIVALFLLRLFLPIIVYLFGLWFMLKLKLCILPQISIDLGAELELGLEGDLGAEVELDVQLTAKLDAILPQTGSLSKWFSEEIDSGDETRAQAAYRKLARMAIDQSIDFSESDIAPETLAEIRLAIENNPGLAPDSNGTSRLPDPTERLIYYPTKQLSEVFQ